MAREYIYLERLNRESVQLQRFKNLQYKYCYNNDNARLHGFEDDSWLDIINDSGEIIASFTVERRNCYVLERRNQSALQLHKVTPPHLDVDQILWLFGFDKKKRCNNWVDFDQTCQEFQEATSDLKITVEEVDYCGSILRYAFATGEKVGGNYLAVAYCYAKVRDAAWAFYGKDFLYEMTARMYTKLQGFRYPLQYAIRIFQGATVSYPVETKNFFQQKLGIQDKDVYYADEPDCGF